MTQNALTADQMVQALNQVFALIGELKIEGNQAQLLINLRSAVAQVNNSLVHYMNDAKQAELKDGLNGKVKELVQPVSAA